MSAAPYTVQVTPELGARLATMKQNAAKSRAMRQGYTCLKRCAEDLLPEHATSEPHLLTGPMRGIVYRVKSGRLRVFYVVNRTDRVAILLDVGMRKDGDKNDAYEVLKRRIRAGDFDVQFAECGHARPVV